MPYTLLTSAAIWSYKVESDRFSCFGSQMICEKHFCKYSYNTVNLVALAEEGSTFSCNLQASRASKICSYDAP